MGSYAELRVGSHYVGASKNSVYDRWLLVFTATDRVVRITDSAEVVAFEAPAAVVADRLGILGATLHRARVSFAVAVQGLLELWTTPPLSDVMVATATQERDFFETYTFEDWCSDFIAASPDPDPVDSEFPGLRRLLELWEESDELHVLRAAVAAVPKHEVVRLDITDLVQGGWVDADLDPRSAALLLAQASSAEGLPIVVLTEGRSDAEFLELALRVLYPHLVGYLRFPDFAAVNAEGGASALARTVKAFAASGIANRVIALFDNDAAGAEALLGIDSASMPPNLKMSLLPTTPTASAYPTVGPTGPALMDCNGSAASLELYMGRDSLATAGGSLRPVLWRGFMHKVQRYQGEVDGKQAVHDAYREKARRALADPACVTGQDWEDMRRIIDMVRETFA